MEKWLTEVGTDPDLTDCIVEYARGRGGEVNERCLRTKASTLSRNGNGAGQDWVAPLHGGNGVHAADKTAI